MTHNFTQLSLSQANNIENISVINEKNNFFVGFAPTIKSLLYNKFILKINILNLVISTFYILKSGISKYFNIFSFRKNLYKTYTSKTYSYKINIYKTYIETLCFIFSLGKNVCKIYVYSFYKYMFYIYKIYKENLSFLSVPKLKDFTSFGIGQGKCLGVDAKVACQKFSQLLKKKNYPCLKVNTDKGIWNYWRSVWSVGLKIDEEVRSLVQLVPNIYWTRGETALEKHINIKSRQSK
jgi:hypothetical protein